MFRAVEGFEPPPDRAGRDRPDRVDRPGLPARKGRTVHRPSWTTRVRFPHPSRPTRPGGGSVVSGRVRLDPTASVTGWGTGQLAARVRAAPTGPRLVPALRRLAGLAALVVVVAALAGCQVKMTVDTAVQPDGSGTVTVGVGLDDDALARVATAGPAAGGRPESVGVDHHRPGPGGRRLHVGAGVQAVRRPGGRDRGDERGERGRRRLPRWKVAKTTSPLQTTYAVTGTVDLTRGADTFGDEQLTQLLGGDAFGGAIPQLEQEEGRPVSDMVDVEVTVSVPGSTARTRPRSATSRPPR